MPAARLLALAAATLIATTLVAPAATPGPAVGQGTCNPLDWTGHWSTEFGEMRLRWLGTSVSGDYDYAAGTLTGTLDSTGCILRGAWEQAEPSNRGAGYDSGTLIFVLAKDGLAWSGTYTYRDSPAPRTGWNGAKLEP